MHGEKYRADPVAHTYRVCGVHAQKACKGGRVGAQRRTSLAQGAKRRERRAYSRAGRGRSDYVMAERVKKRGKSLEECLDEWTAARAVFVAVAIWASMWVAVRIIGHLALMFA